MRPLAARAQDADGGYGHEIRVHLYCARLRDRHSTPSARSAPLDERGSRRDGSEQTERLGDEFERAWTNASLSDRGRSQRMSESLFRTSQSDQDEHCGWPQVDSLFERLALDPNSELADL